MEKNKRSDRKLNSRSRIIQQRKGKTGSRREAEPTSRSPGEKISLNMKMSKCIWISGAVGLKIIRMGTVVKVENIQCVYKPRLPLLQNQS